MIINHTIDIPKKIIYITFESTQHTYNYPAAGVELDIENQSELVDFFDTLLKHPHYTEKSAVLISMKDVIYIDSSGLWSIFESYRKITANNTICILYDLHPDVKRVLDITKISTKINIFDTKQHALTYLQTLRNHQEKQTQHA